MATYSSPHRHQLRRLTAIRWRTHFRESTGPVLDAIGWLLACGIAQEHAPPGRLRSRLLGDASGRGNPTAPNLLDEGGPVVKSRCQKNDSLLCCLSSGCA